MAEMQRRRAAEDGRWRRDGGDAEASCWGQPATLTGPYEMPTGDLHSRGNMVQWLCCVRPGSLGPVCQPEAVTRKMPAIGEYNMTARQAHRTWRALLWWES